MKTKNGFTLIELLVVIAVIGILAAIAIPQFSAYRERAFDARARTDLKNLSTAEEAYFADKEVYAATNCANTVCSFPLPGLPSTSVGVEAEVNLVGTDAFKASASHDQGNFTYCWNSASTNAVQSTVVGAGSPCP